MVRWFRTELKRKCYIRPVKGWEYLIKWSEGRQWGNDYVNQEFWLRYIGEWLMAKIGWTELGLEDISYGQGDIRVHLTPEVH